MIKYDYLVYAVGAETQTFNIPGVKENSCFMKEVKDADKVFLQNVLLRWYTCLTPSSFVKLSWIVCEMLPLTCSNG